MNTCNEWLRCYIFIPMSNYLMRADGDGICGSFMRLQSVGSIKKEPALYEDEMCTISSNEGKKKREIYINMEVT